MPSDMVEVCGLWLEKSKDGKVYMAGPLGRSAKVLIFKNERKEAGSKQSDYHLFVGPARDRRGKEDREGE